MNIKKNTYNILSDMKNNTVGEITLGLTLEHGIDLFTFVFPKFNRRFPGINFHLQERYIRSGRVSSTVLSEPDIWILAWSC